MPNWLKRIFPTHSRRSTPVESWRPTRENVHVPKSVPMKPFMQKPLGANQPRPCSPELDRYNPKATNAHRRLPTSKKNERKQVRFSEKNQVFLIPPRAQIARENMGAQHR